MLTDSTTPEVISSAPSTLSEAQAQFRGVKSHVTSSQADSNAASTFSKSKTGETYAWFKSLVLGDSFIRAQVNEMTNQHNARAGRKADQTIDISSYQPQHTDCASHKDTCNNKDLGTKDQNTAPSGINYISNHDSDGVFLTPSKYLDRIHKKYIELTRWSSFLGRCGSRRQKHINSNDQNNSTINVIKNNHQAQPQMDTKPKSAKMYKVNKNSSTTITNDGNHVNANANDVDDHDDHDGGDGGDGGAFLKDE
jgi:hypothetical protein